MATVVTCRCLRLLALVALAATTAWADEFERPPIEYSKSEPDNCISQLQARLDQGEAKLLFADKTGYLDAVLEALKVPVESQMLVFSKTRLQRHCISPRRPRAIYFNDDVYIGFCRSGDVLEVSAVDPQLGAVFYTLDQREEAEPRFVRQTDSCLLCHSSSRTEGVPGHTVLSMFVDGGGQPIFSAGSYSVDYTTPLEQRWGGWYVTGTHGDQTHLGNLIIQGKEVSQPIDNGQGQYVTDLADRFDVASYPFPHSDLVALMVLEHQTLVHNRLTRATYATKQALHYQEELNLALGEPKWNRLESTGRRIESAGSHELNGALHFSNRSKSMPQLQLESTVGQWVAERPHTSRVFESLQIDYCCGGNKPLQQACTERQLDAQQVLAQLKAVSEVPGTEPADRWSDAPMSAICDHIEQTHHAYLKTELPRLQNMIVKVVAAHGANHPEMIDVQQAFAALRAELEPHMFKEEQVLFPAIRRLEASAAPLAFPFGTIANPIRMMEHEHEQAGDALASIRRATSDYRVPDDACGTYRALLDGLKTLEQDMHQHVHKENSILFPRAIALEGTRVGAL